MVEEAERLINPGNGKLVVVKRQDNGMCCLVTPTLQELLHEYASKQKFTV